MIPITINLDPEDPFLKDTADRINKDYPKTAFIKLNKSGFGASVYVTDQYYHKCAAKSKILATKTTGQIKIKKSTMKRVNYLDWKLSRYLKERGLL